MKPYQKQKFYQQNSVITYACISKELLTMSNQQVKPILNQQLIKQLLPTLNQ